MTDPVLRLRQICLLARDLEWTAGVLSAAFDAPVVFRDPGMAAEGDLTNTHIRLGDSFLETVSPSDHAWAVSTTQTRLLERNGDCGYMAIVQVPDVAAASRSMAVQGSGTGIVAGSWWLCPGAPGSGLAGIESGPYVLGEPVPKTPGTIAGANVQFHPRDFGTLAEIQENWPGHGEFPRNKGAYFPAGNTWQNGVDARPHGRVTTGFAAVEIAPRAGDPAEVCAALDERPRRRLLDRSRRGPPRCGWPAARRCASSRRSPAAGPASWGSTCGRSPARARRSSRWTSAA